MNQYKNTAISLPDFGKVPPQAVDMEEAVLGALLLGSDAILPIMTILKPESFYKESNGKIYLAILTLVKKGYPADMFSVSEYLRSQKELEAIGGPVYLSQLTAKIVTSANVEYHAHIVSQKYIQREIIRISTELQGRAFDDSNDIADLFEYAESELLKISSLTERKESTRLNKLIDAMIDKISKIQSHEIALFGKPTGFTKIDRKTGGLKDGELIIIAGRPSMGKTAIALQIGLNASALNYPVALFSLEMSGEQLAQRCISGASGKTNVQLIEGSCNIDELLIRTENLLRLPVFVDDTPALSIIELRAKARKLTLQYGIKMIIVDYLQLMKGEGSSREQEVSYISRGLKSIAKEFNIPVIALSQLSRKCEERSDKKPMLSDLRESGAIEQDADVVMFVFRPAYYGQRSIIIDNKEENSDGKMEIIIAKNRNGITGSFFLEHNIALTEIKDIEELNF